VKKPRPPSDPNSAKAAYLRALRWLTARELSEAQVRERLEERGYSQEAISPAIKRLKDERALDDLRAATMIARTEAKVHRHGPRRVMGKLVAMRIDRDMAKEVVRNLFGETDEQDLLEATLERRLQGKPERLADAKERRKIRAYLVRQGFSPSSASSLVRKKSRQDSQ
jgi:regulatory protein